MLALDRNRVPALPFISAFEIARDLRHQELKSLFIRPGGTLKKPLCLGASQCGDDFSAVGDADAAVFGLLEGEVIFARTVMAHADCLPAFYARCGWLGVGAYRQVGS